MTRKLLTLLLVLGYVINQFLPLHAADELRVVAWNLEHLNELSNTGCVPRQDQDYVAIRDQIAALDADVVAIQEVESAEAAYRVFPRDTWHIVMSGRPERGNGPECWDVPNQFLRHQGTGFAVRNGIEFTTNKSLTHLAGERSNQRWGTDITVHGAEDVRFLSVHLASGCWGEPQDTDASKTSVCTTLNTQFDVLGQWIVDRDQAQESFVVLGDFNRRLAVAEDWGWSKLTARSANTMLATKTLPANCDPRYDQLIDHVIVSNGLANKILPESIREIPRHGDHPDHCAIALDLNI